MQHWLPATSEHTSKVWRGVGVVQSYKVQHAFNCAPQEQAFILLMEESEESVTLHPLCGACDFTVSHVPSLSHRFSMLWGLILIDHSTRKLFLVLGHYWCFLPTFSEFPFTSGASKTAQWLRYGNATELCNEIMEAFVLFFIPSFLVPVVYTLRIMCGLGNELKIG